MPLDSIRAAKLKKLENFRAAGVNPYPEKSEHTLSIAKALLDFDRLASAKKAISLCGRVMGLRSHGNLFFIDLQENGSKIQLLVMKDKLAGSSYELHRDNLDIGDFISATGTLFTTQKGEKTLEVRELQLLTKSVLPMPSAWYGLEDVEERFRKRYLDALLNPETRAFFEKRFKILQLIRQTLWKWGFLEVETPILQTLAGGALAKPFKTKLDIMDLPLFLRIAPELKLKEFLSAGFTKIFELGKSFRNEGFDREHNPEFTMLELYQAYATKDDLMKLIEKLFKLLNNHFGNLLSLPDKKWPREDFEKLFEKEIGLKYAGSSRDDFLNKISELKLDVKNASKLSKGKLADEIFKKIIRPKLEEPIFMTGHPLDISPLAKQNPKNQEKVLRFQLYIKGMEVANGFSELNDPIEQRKRFEEQVAQKQLGDEETHPLDESFLEMLEYGMPPAAGLGIGIDRLVMLFTSAKNLKEVLWSPIMKPEQ